jgi:hypothetical protein
MLLKELSIQVTDTEGEGGQRRAFKLLCFFKTLKIISEVTFPESRNVLKINVFAVSFTLQFCHFVSPRYPSFFDVYRGLEKKNDVTLNFIMTHIEDRCLTPIDVKLK